MADYGFNHAGTVYTPNATAGLSADTTAERNAVLSPRDIQGDRTRHDYARERANDTGRAYAVFVNPADPRLTYAALNCPENRRAYKSIGAYIVAVYRRQSTSKKGSLL